VTAEIELDTSEHTSQYHTTEQTLSAKKLY